MNMSVPCLFCAKSATTACCSSCRDISRSGMFEALLTLLSKAAIAKDHCNEIKIICQQIETLEWLLTPVRFVPIVCFDPAVHRMDYQAKEYLQKASLDVQDMIPIEVVANGNCLYNSIACLDGTKVLTASELRVRTLIELVKNDILYSNRFANVVGPLDEIIKNISRNFSFSELYEIAGLSNVLGCNIRSVYPNIQYRPDLDIMNRTFDYDYSDILSKTICIFWTHTQSETHARNNNYGNWSPNHFVPLLLSSNNSLSQNIDCSNSTPMKLTIKNNILTQVRVPQFHLEDDERHTLQTSSADSTVTKKISTNQQIQRKEFSTGNHAHTETEVVESQRMLGRERIASNLNKTTPEEAERQPALARERSAARRASTTSEEAERQRTLIRERSANWRAALTPENAEKQRELARERSAARRASVTPEEAERQRRLGRERSAARRASTTSEVAERQRALAREKSAARRASTTSEEAERQRALAREKSAARRASTTSEEAERQRTLTRERTANWRAAFTPEEADRQRTFGKERIMTKRAVAGPIEAEQQRVLARERSTASRAFTTSEEAEQRRQVLACKNTHLQKATTRKQTVVLQRKTSTDDKVEWPKAVEIECKINCLKNFIQTMSMSSLAEGVCGICNVRCYKRDLRRVPLAKIPSIELLKVHDDLSGIIPGIKSANNLVANNKFRENDNLDLLIAMEHIC